MKRRQLKARRAELDMDQFVMARRADIIYSRYVRIENGYTDPTPTEQKAIARVLKVPVEEAFPEVVEGVRASA